MKRKIISITLLFILILLLATGILMYFFPFKISVTALHIFSGTVFFVFVTFHIFKNKKHLKSYLSSSLIRFTLPIALIFILILLPFIREWPLAMELYHWGDSFRKNNLEEAQFIRYEILKTNTNIKGQAINIDVTKGKKAYWTVMAIWLEDEEGNFIQSIYVTQNRASNIFWQEVNGKAQKVSLERPEAVPYWTHKVLETQKDTSKSSPNNEPEINAITSATPRSHYRLKSFIKPNIQRFRVLYEVNRSFDWNEYYNKNAFPNDSIYSGSGNVGQPSLIYSTELIDLNNPRKSYLMQLKGHGHHSGQNGQLYTDVSKISTARDLTQSVLVIIE